MEEQIATAPARMAPLNGKSFSELRRAELKMDFIRQLVESGLARASAERMAAETYPERQAASALAFLRKLSQCAAAFREEAQHELQHL